MQRLLHASILLSILLSFSTGGAIAQEFKILKGNGDIITKEIEITEYSKIEVGGNIKSPDFNYSQRENQPSLKITIDSNLLPYLETQVEDGCLTIHVSDKVRLHPTKMLVESQSAQLNKAAIGGSYQFSFETDLNTPSLELTARGAANVQSNKPLRVTGDCEVKVRDAAKLDIADLQCSHLDTEVKGAGVVYLTGAAKTGKYKVSDAANLHGYNCVIEDLNCQIKGAASSTAHVTEKLQGEISDAGQLKYKGFPRNDIQCSGAGKAKRVK